MKTFISYKYTNVKDKKSLKGELEQISNIVTKLGHSTFILGRDKKNWSSIRSPLWKTIPFIVENISKADVILAYITGCEKSPGLNFELIISKLMHKKIILLVKCGDYEYKFEKRMADAEIKVEDFSKLSTKLAHELK